MAAPANSLTIGSGGNAGPKPPSNAQVHPSVGGKGGGPGRVPKIGTQPTNWLAPLNTNQIRQQATREVQGAYAPAFNEIKSQASRAQAIYDKQTSDNQYYLQWLTTQSAALQAHNDASNQVLENTINSITGQPPQNSIPGVGGSDATELAATAQSDRGFVNNQAAQALTGIGNNNASIAQSALGNANAVMAGGAKESANLQTALNSLNTADFNLLGKQAATIAATIQNAQKTEIAKAEYAQNTGIAETKLGLTAANDQSLAQQRTISEANQTANAKTNAGRLQQTIAQNAATNAINWARISQSDKNYQLNVAKFNQATAKDLYQRNHGLGPYKPAANGSKAYLALASQNVIIQKIQSVSGEMDALIAQGMAPQAAYQSLKRGYYVLGGKKYTTTHISDPVMLNAAYNTTSKGGGLTSGDVTTLTNLGVDPARLKAFFKEVSPDTVGAAGNAGNSTVG